MGGRPWPTAAFAIMMIFLLWLPLFQVEVAGEADPWAYHTSGEICSLLEGLAVEHPDVASYTTAGELLGVRNITTGLEIPILLVGDFDEMRPSSLLIGGHHGDEPDSSESVLGFAAYLLDGYASGDRTATHIVENTNTAILPVVNPWGLDKGIRYDENGEDPNRDYPFDTAPPGFYTDGVPLTTAGASAVHEICRMYPFQISVSFHTGSFGIYTPWGANDVGNLTPDHVSFNDMGYAISKASGWSIPYGPANDFPYVGYLTGAYDDHVYGASFLGDHLYDEEMILPWSTHTATVELVASKGTDVNRLGNLDGVLDPGGENDGTVPAGIRICMAACELVNPHFTAEVTEMDDTISVELELIGSVDPGRPSLSIEYPDGSMESIVLDPLGTDDIFPETSYSFSVDIPRENGTLTMEVTAEPDSRWGEYTEGGYPDISPRSLLSLSRGTNGRFSTISWSEVFLVENIVEPEPEPEPEPVPERGTFEIFCVKGVPCDAGGTFRCSMVIAPARNETILEMTAQVTGTNGIFTEPIYYDEFQYTMDIDIPLPDMEGWASLRVFIRTDHWNYTVYQNFSIIARSNITELPTIVDPLSENTFQVSIIGASSPKTLLYGISRSLDTEWDEEEQWIFGPEYVQTKNRTTFPLEFLMPAVSGELYLRATLNPYRQGTASMFTSSTWARASTIPARVENESLILGPSIVQYTVEGLIEGDGIDVDITYKVYVQHEDGTLPVEGNMTWVPISEMAEKDLEVLRFQAENWSLDPSELTGGWMLTSDLDGPPGEYTIRGNISISLQGELNIWAGQNLTDTPVPMIGGSFFVEAVEEEGDEEDKTGSTIAWIFLLITIAIAFGLLLMKLQNEAKNRREEEGDPPSERRGRRAAAPHPHGRERPHRGDVERNHSVMKFK